MHKITKKIYYHDTDCGGVVYYANYFKYLEEARTEFFADKGIDLLQVAVDGYLFVVKNVEASYKYPARYGQILEVKTKLIRVRSASLQFFQTIETENILLVSAETKIACINKRFKASVIPDIILGRIRDNE